ncbi:hypothetical protein QBC39DRAFT_351566, partial [Podospora conica]
MHTLYNLHSPMPPSLHPPTRENCASPRAVPRSPPSPFPTPPSCSMDPLSIIASTIAITQALGFGIKTLQSIANSNVEFCDMLKELSSLRDWLNQLDTLDLSAVQTLSQDAISRLDNVRSSLQLLAGDLDEITKGFHCRTTSLTATENTSNTKTKISKIAWHRNRNTVLRLQERAKQCREELVAGLGLLGLSEQLHSNKVILKIHSVVESSVQRQETQLVHIQDATSTQCSLLSTMTTRLETIERRLTSRTSNPRNSKSRKPPERAIAKSPLPQASQDLHLPCTRDCKCHCHRTSKLHTPQWVRPAVGSLVLQYNGAISLNVNACNIGTCHSGGRRSARANYMFPPWLLRRGLFVSMAFDSLTNRGASLHIMVPTLLRRDMYSVGLWRAVRMGDTKWVQQRVMESKICPTTVDESGSGILSNALRYGSFSVVRELLKMGFSPNFMDSKGVTAIVAAKEYLLLCSTGKRNAPVVLSVPDMEMLKGIAQLDEDPTDISSPLRDCILGLNDLSIEDALALDSSHINSLDAMGFTPLHHAVIKEDLHKTKALLRHHAVVDIKTGELGRRAITRSAGIWHLASVPARAEGT